MRSHSRLQSWIKQERMKLDVIFEFESFLFRYLDGTFQFPFAYETKRANRILDRS